MDQHSITQAYGIPVGNVDAGVNNITNQLGYFGQSPSLVLSFLIYKVGIIILVFQGVGEEKMINWKNVCEYTLEIKKATTSVAERITGFSSPTLADGYSNNLGYLSNASRLPDPQIKWWQTFPCKSLHLFKTQFPSLYNRIDDNYFYYWIIVGIRWVSNQTQWVVVGRWLSGK